MERRIQECQTLEQLRELEGDGDLSVYEKECVFQRTVEIIQRVLQWREENRAMVLAPNLTDTWTLGERQLFIANGKRGCKRIG